MGTASSIFDTFTSTIYKSLTENPFEPAQVVAIGNNTYVRHLVEISREIYVIPAAKLNDKQVKLQTAKKVTRSNSIPSGS